MAALLLTPLPASASEAQYSMSIDGLKDRGLSIEEHLPQVVTPNELEAQLVSSSPESLNLANGKPQPDQLKHLEGTGFTMDWFTVDAGSSQSSGESFKLWGTVGQPDHMVLQGDEFSLTTGFWAFEPVEPPCLTENVVFCDGFETGNTSEWGTQ